MLMGMLQGVISARTEARKYAGRAPQLSSSVAKDDLGEVRACAVAALRLKSMHGLQQGDTRSPEAAVQSHQQGPGPTCRCLLLSIWALAEGAGGRC